MRLNMALDRAAVENICARPFAVVSRPGNTAVPHRAQHMPDAPLMRFGIDGAEVESSCMRVPDAIGSMLSLPLCIAARTDRRDSQFNDGARSRRIVGSLKVVLDRHTKVCWKVLTNLPSTNAPGMVEVIEYSWRGFAEKTGVMSADAQ